MTDIHYLGEFPTFNAVWKKFPNGGGYGDYVTILGVRYDWDESKNSWGDDPGDVNPALPEVVNHDIDVQGTVTARDGIKTADYIPGTAGAFIDGAGDAEFRSVDVDALRVKDPVTGELLSLPDFIKVFKTELPPDWAEYEQITQFDNVRILAFDPLSQDKFYTTIGALKKLISDSIAAGSTGGGTFEIEVLRSDAPEGIPTDNNVFSSLKTLLAIQAAISTITGKYISKVTDDTAQGVITFLKGLISTTADIEDLKADKGDIKSLTSTTAIIDNITLHKGMSSEVFFPGFLGEGMELFKDEDGNWNFTLDNLTVRKQMNVFELVINRIKHVGGAFLFSPAGGTFIGVEEHDTFWRCYVDKNNNEFEIHDQVICQTFTKNRLKRYWRLAVNIGEDFVDLSKTDCESGSAYPEIDDEAVVLGNRINNARQNAVLISSYGDDGSYQQFLNGVDTYSLADKIDIHFGKESFMRVNRLEIKGTDGKSERVPRDRGIFQPGETYEFYDRVVYNGRYWLCLAINTTSAPSDGEWQEQTNVRAGGKNLLREYDLRFDGKYWQGNYNSQFIDLSMLADYLFNGNNDAIVTENNLYIEI